MHTSGINDLQAEVAEDDNEFDNEPGAQFAQAQVPVEGAGRRLDQILAELFPQYSRSRLQAWNKEGKVRVDGALLAGKTKLFGGEQIDLEAQAEADGRHKPQPIPLDIRYQDEALIILHKPAGLVVHPAAGNADGTLLNALLHYDPELDKVPRAGIVHRLDKETSGLLMVARSLEAQNSLVQQLQARSITREYLAVVFGVLTGGGTVEARIGRHPVERKRMAVTRDGREAVTHYRVVEAFRTHHLLRLQLETGRTHQIRVHMAHIHHPLVGDPLYGGRLRLPPGASPALIETLRGFPRQALHAARLGLVHPLSGAYMEWRAELPEDMQQLIAALRHDRDEVADA